MALEKGVSALVFESPFRCSTTKVFVTGPSHCFSENVTDNLAQGCSEPRPSKPARAPGTCSRTCLACGQEGQRKRSLHCAARGSVGIFVLMHRMVLHHHVQKTYQKQHVPPSGSPNELGKSIVVPKWTLTRTLCGGWHPRCPKPMTIPTAKSSCQRRTLRFRGEVMSCRGMAPISREIQCLTQAWKIWPKTVEDRDALDQ